ncbi:hypothetical protein MFERI13461_00287 [Mycoplasma feriruminatoris]|uniref:hypothetical protein n=1 Tax=Mycoplasma feriruminatoris TaxID=1179777 RepID=UPI00241FF26F|nr:hypothetical protein [Mycoplasma feriruminatoris]WFQ90862.1 hypothetical protein MFERI13461_00287 [Mycoplasma feriruminatoris]
MWLSNFSNSDLRFFSPNNYPFLKVSSLVRSTLEMISYYVVSNSEKFLDKVIEIWIKNAQTVHLNNFENEKKYREEICNLNHITKSICNVYSEKLFKDDNKYVFSITDKQKIILDVRKKIYEKLDNNGVFNLVKVMLSKGYIENREFVKLLIDDAEDVYSNKQKRIIMNDALYISGMITGENLRITNNIIHPYHSLNNDTNFKVYFEALKRQLEILNTIINVWIFNEN